MISFEGKGKIKMIAVPVSGYNFKLVKTGYHSLLSYFYKTDHDGSNSSSIIVLPRGNYEIIGLTSEILKDEYFSRKIAEEGSFEGRGYKNYVNCDLDFVYATDSFQSLLDKYNIKGEHLIIQKKDEK